MDILTETEQAGLSSVAVASAHRRGLELLRIDLRGTKTRPVIEVILDGERQVSIDDCEGVSREIQEHLEALFGEKTAYRLDVLSPGTDEPLVYPYQFKRSLGRKIEVKTDTELKTGILKDIDNEGITLDPPPAKRSKSTPSSSERVLFAEIRKAKVLVEL